jgi:hypothetical protein
MYYIVSQEKEIRKEIAELEHSLGQDAGFGE